jgi:hypothetical protein
LEEGFRACESGEVVGQVGIFLSSMFSRRIKPEGRG